MDKRQSRYQTAGRALTLATAIGLLLSSAVAAPPPGGMPPPPGVSSHDFDAQRQRDQAALHLSPAQTTVFKDFVDKSRTKRMALVDQIKKIHHDLDDAYAAFNFDEGRAVALNNQLNSVQMQLLTLRLSEEKQLRKILNPDQFAILKSQMRKYSQEFRGGWGHPADGASGAPPPQRQ